MTYRLRVQDRFAPRYVGRSPGSHVPRGEARTFESFREAEAAAVLLRASNGNEYVIEPVEEVDR